MQNAWCTGASAGAGVAAAGAEPVLETAARAGAAMAAAAGAGPVLEATASADSAMRAAGASPRWKRRRAPAPQRRRRALGRAGRDGG
ncbi:hypothetical protein [Sorangium cellulosum]|uniref:hypothetical protein n=1 Tax=Sorangium cellulosum TaxID=56 RepID=UPI0013314747|nr:hypothetical protein [Sorangium cellulosum]